MSKIILCENLISEIGSLSTSHINAISTVFARPTSLLEELNLSSNQIADDGISTLANALAANRTLTNLDLCSNPIITLAGWQHFSNCLKNTNSVLKNLNLEKCNIDDEKAAVIFSILSANSSLQSLNMSGNSVTSRGLVAFFHSLLGSKCEIKELRLSMSNINLDDITQEEWGVFSRALCDKDSVNSTFLSNHTFGGLCDEYFRLDRGMVKDFEHLLEMNRFWDKREVPRHKILKCHFSQNERTGIDTLTSMQETVLPYALKWIGRDRRGYDAMFHVVQGLPNLFGISSAESEGAKKRKV